MGGLRRLTDKMDNPLLLPLRIVWDVQLIQRKDDEETALTIQRECICFSESIATGYSRWGWMNIKNYLRPGWGPLQVATNTNTQFVDVSVLPIIW